MDLLQIDLVEVKGDITINPKDCIPYTKEMMERGLYLVLPKGFPKYQELAHLTTLSGNKYHAKLHGLLRFFSGGTVWNEFKLTIPLKRPDIKKTAYHDINTLMLKMDIDYFVDYEVDSNSTIIITFPPLNYS
jgi:hypothetical protein